MATTSSNAPLRLPLVPTIGSRDGSLTKDAKLVNAYLEKDANGEVYVVKRPAFFDIRAGIANAPLGCFYWAKTQLLYFVANGNLYSWDGSGGPNALIGAVVWTSPWVFFQPTLGTPAYLYLSNGAGGFTVSSAGAFAAIVSAAYPAATVPGAAYLDGTLYIMSTDGTIYGSGINDPTTWSALNTIKPQSTSNVPKAIAKQLIYVVALLSQSIEIFYDAANATGSPLLPVPNAQLPIGLAAKYTVQSINDDLYFLGQGSVGNYSVYMMSGLRLKKISTPFIDKLIQATAIAENARVSWKMKTSGHSFYALYYANNLALVFDTEVGEWYLWNTDTYSQTKAFDDLDYMQNLLTGNFATVSPSTYNDLPSGASPQPIVVDAVTSNFDGGTSLRKTLSRLKVSADQQRAGTLLVRWSDDDYETWSPWEEIDLSQDDFVISNLGTFKKRAFQFRHSSNSPFRMKASELELLVGSL